jgi:hypothetical protein
VRPFSARRGGETEDTGLDCHFGGRGRWSFRPIWLRAASRGFTPAWFSPATIDQGPVVLVADGEQLADRVTVRRSTT